MIVVRENSEGEYLTNYDTYLVAEFGVGTDSPIVCDYALAIADEEFDDKKVGTMSFVNAFAKGIATISARKRVKSELKIIV